jgi:nucleotide-binding universal stress UspA family protein
MNPWIVLLALALIATLYVVLPIGAATFARARRPWRLRCPRTGREAQIKLDATGAAVAEVLGREARSIERCSLWPALRGCRQECLALPAWELKVMRRGEAPPRARAQAGIKTILVALDGSPGSESILPAVRDLASAHGARVRLLTVVSPVTAVRSDERVVAFADQETERVELEARAYLKRTAAGLPGVAVDEAVRFGAPVTEIVEEAEAEGADLIALAAHRRNPLVRLFKGSTAGALERATTIPILLVPYGRPAAA